MSIVRLEGMRCPVCNSDNFGQIDPNSYSTPALKCKACSLKLENFHWCKICKRFEECKDADCGFDVMTDTHSQCRRQKCVKCGIEEICMFVDGDDKSQSEYGTYYCPKDWEIKESKK